MEPNPQRNIRTPARAERGSIARKYSVFTALLLAYVNFVIISLDIHAGTFSMTKAVAMAALSALIAGIIAKYTNRVLARPLQYLLEGITSVREGRLEPIRVSRTRDEVEFVAESFNAMIDDLAAYRDKLREYQESLEDLVRQRTRALEEASLRAQAASKAKSEFLANMSHELRTPLTGVLGMLDIVLDGDLAPEQREQLVTAKNCARSLLGLLNDLLDLSKIEAGKMSFEEIPFDFHVTVRETIAALRTRAGQKDVELRVRIGEEVPRMISGDPLRWRQILNNLLSNAIKFTEEGWVELRICRSPAPAEPGGPRRLIVEVEDTGPGIPADKLGSIFEEFTQADGSISRRYGGTGLGLAITRRLVEMMGGQISVVSTVGKGSTFRVEAPCRPVSPWPGPRKGPARQAPASDPTRARRASKGRVLIVEDNTVNQRVFATILKREGYDVELASDGEQAIAALDRSAFSLVLMDIQMPGVDGLTATHQIRRNPAWDSIPIVAVTAHSPATHRDLCLKEGMDAFLTKPVNRAALLSVVEQYAKGGRKGPAAQPVARDLAGCR